MNSTAMKSPGTVAPGHSASGACFQTSLPAKGEAAVGTVAFDKFGQPIGALVDDCKASPKETLWQKLKKHL